MLITARYAGVCRGCGGRIEEGERVYWAHGEGVAHGVCPEDPAPVPPPSVDLGTYTVVFGGDLEDYATVRLHEPGEASNFRGKVIASFLRGPDNSQDFQAFGFLYPDGIQVWNRYIDGDAPSAKIMRYVRAVRVVIDATENKRAEYGYTYAMKSSRCYRCNKKLTIPVSIHRGMGAACAAKAAA